MNWINIDKVALIYVDGVLNVRENEKRKMENEKRILNLTLMMIIMEKIPGSVTVQIVVGLCDPHP